MKNHCFSSINPCIRIHQNSFYFINFSYIFYIIHVPKDLKKTLIENFVIFTIYLNMEYQYFSLIKTLKINEFMIIFFLLMLRLLRSNSLYTNNLAAASFPRCFSTTNKLLATIGIRREDKNRWERRVPLSPDHVQTLVDQGIDVIVQPSSLRIFDNESYADVCFFLATLFLYNFNGFEFFVILGWCNCQRRSF